VSPDGQRFLVLRPASEPKHLPNLIRLRVAVDVLNVDEFWDLPVPADSMASGGSDDREAQPLHQAAEVAEADVR
jgi:hypothetical protein